MLDLMGEDGTFEEKRVGEVVELEAEAESDSEQKFGVADITEVEKAAPGGEDIGQGVISQVQQCLVKDSPPYCHLTNRGSTGANVQSELGSSGVESLKLNLNLKISNSRQPTSQTDHPVEELTAVVPTHLVEENQDQADIAGSFLGIRGSVEMLNPKPEESEHAKCEVSEEPKPATTYWVSNIVGKDSLADEDDGLESKSRTRSEAEL